MVNIFEETLPSDGIALADMISQCTEYPVAKEYAIPETICRPCLMDLQAAIEMKKAFERSSTFYGTLHQRSMEKREEQLYEEKDEDCNSQSLKNGDSAVDFFKTGQSRHRKANTKYENNVDFDGCFDEAYDDPNDKDFVARNNEVSDDDYDVVNSKYTLQQHDRKRPFKCPECSKGFSYKGNLKSHIQNVHNGERRFQCPHCKKHFSHKGNLQCHIRVHTRERPYKCTQCSSAFVKNHNLKVHMRIHTGEVLFRCTICPAALSRRDYFDAHMTSHTDEKLHKCSGCPMTFRLRNSLLKHIQRKHST